jgi:hypothetical protein
MHRTLRSTNVVTAALAAVITLASRDAHANCEASDLPGLSSATFNSTLKLSLRVAKGEACSQLLTAASDTVGHCGGPEIVNAYISRRPAHGVAGASGSLVEHGFSYAPSPGFLGSDHFAVEVELAPRIWLGGASCPSNVQAPHVKTTIEVDVVVVGK